MPVINLCSPKGGAGTTTVAANIAYSLARKGKKVLVIDFDLQNAIRLHFGISRLEGKGFIRSLMNGGYWLEDLFIIKDNLYVLPYGDVTYDENILFWEEIRSKPGYILSKYSEISGDPDLFILTDFKADTYHVHNTLKIQDSILVNIFQADAASAALLASFDKRESHKSITSSNSYAVINQFDHESGLSRAVKDIFSKTFHEKLLGVINYDYKVVKSHAAQKCIYDYCPESPAALAIEVISNRILANLNRSAE